MAGKKFVEEFNIKIDASDLEQVSDYETFQNKALLDELRNKIIQNLIDNNINKAGNMDEFIKEQISKTLEGYDLTNIERSYIYNLIDN